MKIEIPYCPQPHQKELHNSTNSLIAVCGRQIGKTVCAVNEIIKRAVKKPKSRNWYVTNDYKQAKRNVWDLFKHYTPEELIIKKTEQDLRIELINGSKIELIGVENAEKLRGAVVDFMVLDEYADFPRHLYHKVLEPMFSTTNGQVWFIGTPKGLGNDFYDKWQSGLFTKYNFKSCELSGSEVISVTNKYASIDMLQSIYDRLISTGQEDTFRQEYLGDFTRPTGTVYKEWELNHFMDFEYNENLPLHLTFDFGVNDPTAIIWIQPNGSETRVVDYYEASNANIEHFIQVIKSKPYKDPEFCTGDVSGNARDLTTGKTPIDFLEKAGYRLRTSHIPNIPAQIRVAHGKINGLFISSKRAERFRDIILNYRYPELKEGLRNQENEIPLHDEWSHGARAFEYWCWNYNPPTQKLKPKIDTNSGAWLIQEMQNQALYNKLNI